jgi:mRNA interferase MazF
MGDDAGSIVLSDQVKSLDWCSRDAKRKGRVSADVLVEVRATVQLLSGKRTAQSCCADSYL